jgi:vacuolar-type H+-ATPase subunit E/Vma4
MTNPDVVPDQPGRPGSGYNRRDPGQVLPDGPPDRKGLQARAIAYFEKHIKVNEGMSMAAGKLRNVVDKPIWERIATATVAALENDVRRVPQKTPQLLTADHIGELDEGFTAEQLEFINLRDMFMLNTRNAVESVVSAVHEASEQVVQKIADCKEYEWVEMLAGGQQLLDDGTRLAAVVAELEPMAVRYAGELLASAGKSTDPAELAMAKDELVNLQGVWTQYNTVVSSVITHVQMIIDDEAWKAVLARQPQSPKRKALIEGSAMMLGAVVSGAKKVSPAVWGVGMAGGGALLGISVIKNKLLKRLRDLDIAELKNKEGVDPENYAFDMMNEDMTLMADRILEIQRDHTSLMVMTVGVPLSEFSMVWDPLRPLLIGSINSYYEARVIALRKVLKDQGLQKKPNGLKEALKEWLAETTKELTKEKVAEGAMVVLATLAKALLRAGKKVMEAVAEFCKTELPSTATEITQALAENLVSALIAKLASLLIAKLPIAIAQPITGDMMREMKSDIGEYRNSILDAMAAA